MQRIQRDELSHLAHQITAALAYVVGIVPAPPPYDGAHESQVIGAGVVITPATAPLVITCYIQVKDSVTCVSERCVVVQTLIAAITRRTLNRDVVVNVIVTDLLA